MMRTIKTTGKTMEQSAEIIKKAKALCNEKPKSSKSFIAAAKENSESYKQIQKMRKSIESK